jgi:hypothetical protein
MAIGETSAGRQSPFERLLDELEEDESALPYSGVPIGAQRLWPRAGAAPPAPVAFQGGAVEHLYAENASGRETASSPARPENPEKPIAAPEFVEIEAELAAAKSLDELRRLRRRCARSAHPDVVGPQERPQAEKRMAEVNAAIDRAIKQRRFTP